MNADDVFLPFPQPQCDATFLRRPQRFLAEMRLTNGVNEVAYCANSGSMGGCLAPGRAALLWNSVDLTRKLRYTLRAIDLNGLWVGTDTHLSNRIVEEALRLKLIRGMEDYSVLTRERLIEEGFRVDFVLTGTTGDCLLEVKSSAAVENGVARYPDCPTPRGVKQLQALTRLSKQGKCTAILFLVQRSDAHSFVVSSSFDRAYAIAFEEAVAAGVKVLALSVAVSRLGFSTPKLLPYALAAIVSIDTSKDTKISKPQTQAILPAKIKSEAIGLRARQSLDQGLALDEHKGTKNRTKPAKEQKRAKKILALSAQ